MNNVPAAGWVKDLIESQYKWSASLAAAVGSSVAPIVVMQYRSLQSPSQSQAATRGAHRGVLGCEARVGVEARHHDRERANQERGHGGCYTQAGARHVDPRGTACCQTR